MKKLFVCALSAWSLSFAALNALEEVWTFSDPDGMPLHQSLSDKGNSFVHAGSPIMVIRDGQLEFGYDGVEEHTFRQSTFGAAPFRTGILELSWTFTSADFSRTAAVSGSANVGFDLRDLKGTRQNNKDDVIFGSFRLRYDKGKILAQVRSHDSAEFISMAQIEMDHMEHPLDVRMRLNLDERDTPGAFKVFLKLGDEDEISAIDDATLPITGEITGFRVFQQTRNGKTNWQEGDTVTLDNFKLSAIR